MGPGVPRTSSKRSSLRTILATVGILLGLDPACGSESVPSTQPDQGTAPANGGSFHSGTTRGDLPETTCDISVVSSELSATIPTVGIVTFTTSLLHPVAAEIEFGPDLQYGLVAPVDLKADGLRTLLLGMTQDSTYHYRIAVSDGASVCHGEDRTIKTGTLNSRALARVSTSPLTTPGFIITSRDGEAVIYNQDGELVWALKLWNVFSVQLSWEGTYLIGHDPGPFDLGDGGKFYRVKMDGSELTEIDAPGGDHHDFAVIPGGIAYLAKTNEGECDQVYEASLELTDGVPVFDTWQIYQYFPVLGEVEGTEICHANRIHYSVSRDAYTVSDRNKDALTVFTKSGVPLFSIGATPQGNWTQHIQAEGAGLGGDWHVQHGHHFYAEDKLVVFSNESSGGAAILHYAMAGGTASLDWKYSGAGASKIQGDVQRLANGHFLVTANLSGTIVELDADGKTEIARYVLGGPSGPLYGFGYSTHRPSLYGVPPSW